MKSARNLEQKMTEAVAQLRAGRRVRLLCSCCGTPVGSRYGISRDLLVARSRRLCFDCAVRKPGDARKLRDAARAAKGETK